MQSYESSDALWLCPGTHRKWEETEQPKQRKDFKVGLLTLLRKSLYQGEGEIGILVISGEET